MAVEDVYTQNRRLWVRAAREGRQAARDAVPQPRRIPGRLSRRRVREDPKGPLFRFRTIGRGTGAADPHSAAAGKRLCDDPPGAAAAGIATKLGNHSFRATGITAYLKNGGTLEKAAAMANHASTRTTQLYDRRRDEVSLDEVERIVI
jgi:integrase